jgi:putative phage-type endonuclease
LEAERGAIVIDINCEAEPKDQATKREAWLASRKDAIGASEVAAILGMSSFAGPWEVWADKTNRIEDWKGNKSTRAGQVFEPAVLDHAESELGPLRRNIRLKHPSAPLAATLDAQVISTSFPVEAKTTGIVGPVFGKWGDAMTDEVPEYYLVQVHAQLAVTGAELAYLFALIAGRGVVQFEIQRSESLSNHLLTIVSDWWQKHVVADVEPSRLQVPPPLEVVKRLRRVPKKQIAFGLLATDLVRRRERLNKAKLTIEKRLKEADAQVLLALGDAESATLIDGKELTYFETNRAGYTVEPTKYRTLRIKGAK